MSLERLPGAAPAVWTDRLPAVWNGPKSETIAATVLIPRHPSFKAYRNPEDSLPKTIGAKWVLGLLARRSRSNNAERDHSDPTLDHFTAIPCSD